MTEDVLTPFRDLYNSNIAHHFKKLDKNTVPLPLVGHLLNYIGNHLLSYIYQTLGKKIFFPMHKAVSV